MRHKNCQRRGPVLQHQPISSHWHVHTPDNREPDIQGVAKWLSGMQLPPLRIVHIGGYCWALETLMGPDLKIEETTHVAEKKQAGAAMREAMLVSGGTRVRFESCSRVNLFGTPVAPSNWRANGLDLIWGHWRNLKEIEALQLLPDFLQNLRGFHRPWKHKRPGLIALTLPVTNEDQLVQGLQEIATNNGVRMEVNVVPTGDSVLALCTAYKLQPVEPPAPIATPSTPAPSKPQIDPDQIERIISTVVQNVPFPRAKLLALLPDDGHVDSWVANMLRAVPESFNGSLSSDEDVAARMVAFRSSAIFNCLIKTGSFTDFCQVHLLALPSKKSAPKRATLRKSRAQAVATPSLAKTEVPTKMETALPPVAPAPARPVPVLVPPVERPMLRAATASDILGGTIKTTESELRKRQISAHLEELTEQRRGATESIQNWRREKLAVEAKITQGEFNKNQIDAECDRLRQERDCLP
jgi:hypothetical protein